MEIIYIGDESLLADKLIELTIKNKKINPLLISTIEVDCYMPRDNALHLWEITITIYTVGHYHIERYYSKNCIRHGYKITYLTHLKNMGEKKVNLKDMVLDD